MFSRKKKDKDKTDPFMDVGELRFSQQNQIIAENEQAVLLKETVNGKENVKWLAKEKLLAKQERLEKLLNVAVESLPWIEELLLEQKGYCADSFTHVFGGVLASLSLQEMLSISLEAYTLEENLFRKASLAFQGLDESLIFLKDANITPLAGHRWRRLRIYSLELLDEAQTCEFLLSKYLASSFVNELKNRIASGAIGVGLLNNLNEGLRFFKELARVPAKGKEMIYSLRLTFEIATVGDIGKVRLNNEDALLVEESRLIGTGRSFSLLAVADGMGGHAGGEVASSVTLELLRCYAPSWALATRSHAENEAELPDLICQHIKMVNEEVLEIASRTPELTGMGTTLTGIFVSYDGDSKTGVPIRSVCSLVFNVGDSRTFKVGFGGYAPLTKDHSLVQELVDAGRITEEEAFYHPNKNIVSQAIGTRDEMKPDVFNFRIPLDAYIVIASDGLTDLVHPNDLAKLAEDSKTAEELAKAYLNAALEAGGMDNISVIVFKPELHTS